jgi:hypothetical protein
METMKISLASVATGMDLVLADLDNGWKTPVESEPMRITRITETRVELSDPKTGKLWGVRVGIDGMLSEVFVIRDHQPYIHRNVVAVRLADPARRLWAAQREVAGARLRVQLEVKKSLKTNPDADQVAWLVKVVDDLASAVEAHDRVVSEIDGL